MSGGGKLEVINTRERAVSQDINRLQAFLQFDRAEILRRLVDCRSTETGITAGGGVMEAGSYIDTTAMDNIAIGTPLKGDVIEGLVVLPQPGSLNLLVSPGCVVLDDPDGQAGSSDPNPPNPDDSRLKLVVDPGQQTAGVLVLTAGAGSTRIDVLECQRMTTVVETDNRDIFDPSTGLFSAVAVTKVTEGRLNYRVRAGTPGAGLPANVQGWLPLAVVSVPASATSVDDCIFWDVRPLVKDRVAPPTDLQSALGVIDPASFLTSNDFTDTAKTRVFGIVQARAGMYVAGGSIDLDFQDVANQAQGSSFTASTPWYIWAVFPGGLPRWVRYQDFPSPRIPNGPRGIITAYQLGAFDKNLIALQTIPPPTATGITGAQPAVVLAAGVAVDLGGGAVPGAFTLSGDETKFANGNFVQGPAAVPAGGGTIDQYSLVAGTHFPLGAKAVRCAIACRFNGTVDVGCIYSTQITVYANGTMLAAEVIDKLYNNSEFTALDPITGKQSVLFEVWIPRALLGQAVGYATANMFLEVAWAPTAFTGAVTIDNSNLLVTGWKI